MRWLDAISAASKTETDIDHFEDHSDFKRCSELPNVILGVSNDSH